MRDGQRCEWISDIHWIGYIYVLPSNAQTTTARGTAVVPLPVYFSSIHRAPRSSYQPPPLTASFCKEERTSCPRREKLLMLLS